MKKQDRNEIIDTIKGIAIILMIMGHCIQYGSGQDWMMNDSFYDNFLFKFIYSFHMPLFMLISGYLFYYSIKKYSFFYNLQKRVMTLLVPIVTWSFLYNAINAIIKGEAFISVPFIKQCIWYAIGSFWFLWAVFYCSLVVMFVNKFFKDSLLVYIAILLVTFIMPDSYNLYLYKFVYPFFVIGYMGNKYGFSVKEMAIKKWSMILEIAVYSIVLVFYSRDIYIYNSHYRILGHSYPMQMLFINLFRFIVGLWGSIIIIRIVCKTYKIFPNVIGKVFALFGENSLGVYIISGFIFPIILMPLCAELTGINYFIILLETLLISVVAYLCTIGIKKITIMNFLFLGGRK